MPTPKKPNVAKIKKALKEVYESLDSLESARLDFGLTIYNAGNKDKDSFTAAVKEAIKEHHRTRSNFNLSDKHAGLLFDDVVLYLRQQKEE